MSHLPFLRQYAKDVDKILAEWKAYKRKVPVHGAIILDESLDEVNIFTKCSTFPRTLRLILFNDYFSACWCKATIRERAGAFPREKSMKRKTLLLVLLERYFLNFARDFTSFEDDFFQVIEETGFDIRPYCDPEDFLVQQVHEQKIQLYIAYGVSKSTIFQPKTRCEIKVRGRVFRKDNWIRRSFLEN